MINSFTVLSHHRTYRSVYGGSLEISYLCISFCKTKISKILKPFVSKGQSKYRTIGYFPVAFSGVGIFPCLEVINAKFYQIIVSGFDLLPLFPIRHPNPTPGPYIELLALGKIEQKIDWRKENRCMSQFSSNAIYLWVSEYFLFTISIPLPVKNELLPSFLSKFNIQ